MKKALLSAAVLAAFAAPAMAADLPARKAAPVYLAPPPPALWTGFYVSLNAGGTFGDDNTVNVQNPGGSVPAFLILQATGAVPTQISANNDGFIGGGQVGYNWQWGQNWVLGAEADIGGLAGSSNHNSVVGAFGPFGFVTSAHRSIDYIGTVRGRIGFLFTPTLLLYGTGGFAYGGFNMGLSLFGPAPFALSSSYSNTLTGWTAGGGVEWMFMPNWSAKIEYLRYDLGHAQGPAGIIAGGGNFDTLRPAADVEGHIVRAGVNYHFNWAPAPVIAKY